MERASARAFAFRAGRRAQPSGHSVGWVGQPAAGLEPLVGRRKRAVRSGGAPARRPEGPKFYQTVLFMKGGGREEERRGGR